MAAWWTKDPDEHHGYEQMWDPEYRLRDPNEAMADRRGRYVKQIADAHGVDHPTATQALKHVFHHVNEGDREVDPTKYGFASSAADRKGHYSIPTTRKIMDPETWKHSPVQDVSLHEPVHATQNYVKPSHVAHNLFHPGEKAPESEPDAIGDPDYHPSWGQFEDEEGSGETSQAERDLENHARFVRRTNGRLEVADGHHRVAADMLLGKSHTRGRVVHERDL
jgi:hypothetical protein